MAAASSASFASWNTPLSNRDCALVFMRLRRVLSEAKVLPEKRTSRIVVGRPSDDLEDDLHRPGRAPPTPWSRSPSTSV